MVVCIDETVKADDHYNLPQDQNQPEYEKGVVLAVDDESQIRKIYSMIIPPFVNLKVDLAANGSEALEKIMQKNYAVVIMDLHMPVMDGRICIANIHELCAQTGKPLPAIIVVTGFNPDVLGNYNTFQIMKKPFSVEDLTDVVKRAYDSKMHNSEVCLPCL